MNKFLLGLIVLMCMGVANAQVCTAGGVDAWPMGGSAKPFPWDTIQGTWQMGSDNKAFIKIRVVGEADGRKNLKFYLFNRGMCSRFYAKGVGYVDANEKNTVRGLVSDQDFNYLLKLGLFSAADLNESGTKTAPQCNGLSIMALSMQLVGNHYPSTATASAEDMEEQIIVLKKVSNDPSVYCKRDN